ncbi:switch-associated protein 70-like [Ochlerotatus camptorhynchus]|uniref:switch-associated protein 70-like n=1 Tax=Ochlerotatus camptorhynchus TaxID=644619 RepID=UPI0031DEC1A0
MWKGISGSTQQGVEVLTANIATLLDLYGVERGLDHYRSTPTLNFDHYLYYLGQEVFSSVSNELPLSAVRNYEGKIDEVCWLVCHKDFLLKDAYFMEEAIYQLFRIFCMMADLYNDNADDNQFTVKIHPSEALIVVKQLLNSLGLDYNNEEKYDYLKKWDDGLDFGEFLAILRFKDFVKLNDYAASICEAIRDIYQTLIMDVIKKGYLFRRGYVLPTFREYFFVLQPCELTYYKHHTDREVCGTIALDSKFTVKPFIPSSGKTERVPKFTLVSGDRTYELGAQDHKTRLQWISVLQLAITYSTGREGFQRDTVNILDSALTFRLHYNDIISRANRQLGFIFKIANVFRDPLCLRSLYCALIRSILESNAVVWCPYQLTWIARIEAIQRKFVRYALRDLPWRDPLNLPQCEDRCRLLGIVTLDDPLRKRYWWLKSFKETRIHLISWPS